MFNYKDKEGLWVRVAELLKIELTWMSSGIVGPILASHSSQILVILAVSDTKINKGCYSEITPITAIDA